VHRFRTLLCILIAARPRPTDRPSLACCQMWGSCPHPSGPDVKHLRGSARRPPGRAFVFPAIYNTYSQSGRTFFSFQESDLQFCEEYPLLCILSSRPLNRSFNDHLQQRVPDQIKATQLSTYVRQGWSFLPSLFLCIRFF